jgi:hypothetical protein
MFRVSMGQAGVLHAAQRMYCLSGGPESV